MSQNQHEILIEAKYRDLLTMGVRKSKKELRGFGDEAQRSKEKVDGFGTRVRGIAAGPLQSMKKALKSTTLRYVGLAAAITAAAVAARKGIGTFAKNERAMAEVATISPEVAASIDGITDSVAQLALRFGVAEDEVAKGLYQTISSGVTDPVEALKTLRVALGLATAGIAGSTETTDLLVGTMNAFGESAGDAEHIADIMFATVRRGKTTIGELAASMSMVTPQAAALGVSLEEVNAAVATITLSGAPTAIAVTQVGAALSGLLKKSADIDLALRGVNSSGKGFDLMRLRTEGLIPVLEDLRQAYAGNEEGLTELLGRKEAMLAVFGLTGDKAAVFGDILEDVTMSSGSATEALDRMATTSALRMASLGEAIQQGFGVLGGDFIDGVLGTDGLAGGLDASEAAAEGLRSKIAELGPVVSLLGESVGFLANRAVELAAGIDKIRGKDMVQEWIKTTDALQQSFEYAEKTRQEFEAAGSAPSAGAAAMKEWSIIANRYSEALADYLRSLENSGGSSAEALELQRQKLAEVNAAIAVNIDNLLEFSGAWTDGADAVDGATDSIGSLQEAAAHGALGLDPLTAAMLGGTVQADSYAEALARVAAMIGGASDPLPKGMTATPGQGPGAGMQGPTGPYQPFIGPALGPAYDASIMQGPSQDNPAADPPDVSPPKGAAAAWANLHEKVNDTAQTQENFVAAGIEGIGFGMTNAIMDMASGAKSAKDAFSDFASSFLADMARMIIQQQVFNAISAIGLASGLGSGGGAEGGLGAVTAGANGGMLGKLAPVKGYADGGPIVTKPHIALIGEGRHDEAVVPMPGGKEIPVNLTGSGGAQVTINITAMDGQDVERALMRGGQNTIRTVVQDAMMTHTAFRNTMRGGRG